MQIKAKHAIASGACRHGGHFVGRRQRKNEKKKRKKKKKKKKKQIFVTLRASTYRGRILSTLSSMN